VIVLQVKVKQEALAKTLDKAVESVTGNAADKPAVTDKPDNIKKEDKGNTVTCNTALYHQRRQKISIYIIINLLAT